MKYFITTVFPVGLLLLATGCDAFKSEPEKYIE